MNIIQEQVNDFLVHTRYVSGKYNDYIDKTLIN